MREESKNSGKFFLHYSFSEMFVIIHTRFEKKIINFSREILFSPNSDIPKKWTFSHRSFESSEENFPGENFLQYSQSLVP